MCCLVDLTFIKSSAAHFLPVCSTRLANNSQHDHHKAMFVKYKYWRPTEMYHHQQHIKLCSGLYQDLKWDSMRQCGIPALLWLASNHTTTAIPLWKSLKLWCPDVFNRRKICQNSFMARAPPQTLYSTPQDPLAGFKSRVGIVGGLGSWTPTSCLQMLIFEWKSAFNFNSWAKFQTFRQLTTSSFRSFPTLFKRAYL